MMQTHLKEGAMMRGRRKVGLVGLSVLVLSATVLVAARTTTRTAYDMSV